MESVLAELPIKLAPARTTGTPAPLKLSRAGCGLPARTQSKHIK